MRVLLLTAYFPPDTGSAAHLFYDLGLALMKRGHQVTVLTSMPGYHAAGLLESYRRKLWLWEEVNGMNVLRVATPQLPRRSRVGRALWQFGGALALLLVGLKLLSRDLDATIVYSPPLPLGLTAWRLRRSKGIPFILNVQDLFPQSAIDLGLLRNRWLIRGLEAMERFVYSKADHITVHSPGNRAHILAKGVPLDRISVIPNWVDIDFIRPGEKENSFRTEHKLGKAFVVSFAGILGYSQDLDVVLEAAAILRDRDDIIWLIVGDGVEKPRLEVKACQMGLRNVRFLPMQPRARYPAVLQASDVCLVTLRAAVKTPVVPSKILSAMAAARPVIAALDPGGDAPRLLEEAACGICVPPGNPPALAEAVLRLYQGPTLREQLGQNGRRYAEEHLSLEVCASQYEQLVRRLTRSADRSISAAEHLDSGK